MLHGKCPFVSEGARSCCPIVGQGSRFCCPFGGQETGIQPDSLPQSAPRYTYTSHKEYERPCTGKELTLTAPGLGLRIDLSPSYARGRRSSLTSGLPD